MTRHHWPPTNNRGAGVNLILTLALIGLVVDHVGWHTITDWLITAGIDALEGANKTNGY